MSCTLSISCVLYDKQGNVGVKEQTKQETKVKELYIYNIKCNIMKVKKASSCKEYERHERYIGLDYDHRQADGRQIDYNTFYV